jgi:hypothetical protein
MDRNDPAQQLGNSPARCGCIHVADPQSFEIPAECVDLINQGIADPGSIVINVYRL